MNNLKLLSGTAIQTEKGYYFIKNGKRMVIPGKKVLKSWNFKRVAQHSESAVSHYPVLGRLGFRDGTLLFCIANATYYIVSNNQLHLVEDPAMLEEHGLKLRDAFIVSKKEKNYHKVAGEASG